MNRCDMRRRQNGKLKTVHCCLKCHAMHDAAEREGGEVDPQWVCCEIYHFENVYKPSTRTTTDLST